MNNIEEYNIETDDFSLEILDLGGNVKDAYREPIPDTRSVELESFLADCWSKICTESR